MIINIPEEIMKKNINEFTFLEWMKWNLIGFINMSPLLIMLIVTGLIIVSTLKGATQ